MHTGLYKRTKFSNGYMITMVMDVQRFIKKIYKHPNTINTVVINTVHRKNLVGENFDEL